MVHVCHISLSGVATPGDVRLLGDTADYRGAVEYYDTQLGWTGICADSAHADSWLSSTAAQIVCAQLGYEGGRPFVQRYRVQMVNYLRRWVLIPCWNVHVVLCVWESVQYL